MLKMSSLKNPLMKDISDKNVEQLVQSGEKFHEILIIMYLTNFDFTKLLMKIL